MEKPQITITSLDFLDRLSFVLSRIVYIAEITYNQSDVDYSLKASGEGLNASRSFARCPESDELENCFG